MGVERTVCKGEDKKEPAWSPGLGQGSVQTGLRWHRLRSAEITAEQPFELENHEGALRFCHEFVALNHVGLDHQGASAGVQYLGLADHLTF
jgi:hypothetical protein